MSTGFWPSSPNDEAQPGRDQSLFDTCNEQSSLSPFASMGWQELANTMRSISRGGNTADGALAASGAPESSRCSALQIADNGQRFAQNSGGAERVFSVGPTQLIPSEIHDLQASFDAQSLVVRSLRWLRENTPEHATGVNTDIVDADTIRRLAQGINGARDLLVANLPPGRNPPLLQMGLGQSIFEHAERMFPNDPQRQRTEVGVQVALIGRSLNQELERLGSPVRLGQLQVGVDQEGNTFLGLPVRHNGVETNILRFPPLPSPQELQRRRENLPRFA